MNSALKCCFLMMAAAASTSGLGQLSITSAGSTTTITFDATLSGVGNGAFAGAGFQSAPGIGQLDSDAWAVTGFSDGALAFGGTRTTGDHARGLSNSAVSTGGIYAFNDPSIGSTSLGIQPGGSDWAPGTLVLRIVNNTGGSLNSFNIAYELWVRNDQGRGNSFNFSWGTDGLSFTAMAALDYTSPAAPDALGFQLINRSTNITGFTIANGGSLYLRWSGSDVSGSGNRDEFALDDISVSGTFCNAAITCNGNGACNTSGGCDCNTGFTGATCNQCAPNYYNYPACTFCMASITCNGNGTCNTAGGCNCDTGFAGPNCSQCAPDYYGYPNCTYCPASQGLQWNGTACVACPTAGVSIQVSSGTNPTCSGSSITFQASPVDGGSNPIFEWRKDGDLLQSGPSAFFTDAGTTGGSISCTMIGNAACYTGNGIAISNTIGFTVQQPTFWYADTDEDGFGDPASSTSACAAPPDHVANSQDCDDDDAGITTIWTSCSDGDPGTTGDIVNGDCICAGVQFISMQLTVLLAGPHGNGTMNTALRHSVPPHASLIPTAQPYNAAPWNHSGTESIDPAMLDLMDGTEYLIVDWILIEVRGLAPTYPVLARHAALLTRNGQVIATDGGSPLAIIGMAPGNYHIAVRHRNHLGAMTANAIGLSHTPVIIDFSDPALATYGTNARNISGSKAMLWCGNTNADFRLRYSGSGNDRDPIIQQIYQEHTLPVPTSVVQNVYSNNDVNLDGVVKYANEANDRDPILVNIGGTVSTATRMEQLP